MAAQGLGEDKQGMTGGGTHRTPGSEKGSGEINALAGTHWASGMDKRGQRSQRLHVHPHTLIKRPQRVGALPASVNSGEHGSQGPARTELLHSCVSPGHGFHTFC